MFTVPSSRFCDYVASLNLKTDQKISNCKLNNNKHEALLSLSKNLMVPDLLFIEFTEISARQNCFNAEEKSV